MLKKYKALCFIYLFDQREGLTFIPRKRSARPAAIVCFHAKRLSMWISLRTLVYAMRNDC